MERSEITDLLIWASVTALTIAQIMTTITLRRLIRLLAALTHDPASHTQGWPAPRSSRGGPRSAS